MADKVSPWRGRVSCPPYNGTKVSIEGPGSDDHDGMRQGDRWNPDPSTHEHQRIE